MSGLRLSEHHFISALLKNIQLYGLSNFDYLNVFGAFELGLMIIIALYYTGQSKFNSDFYAPVY